MTRVGAPQSATPWKLDRLRWRETRARIRADHRRFVAMRREQRPDAPGRAYLHPAFLAVLLYRLSNHLYRAGHPWLARLFWHLNLVLTGADISEPADIGEGFVVPTPAGVAIMGVAGRNLTVMACSGLGGEMGRRDDIGAGPGLPVLGDDVTMEPHTGALGPIRIGDSVRICAGAVVTGDVPANSVVAGHRTRVIAQREERTP